MMSMHRMARMARNPEAQLLEDLFNMFLLLVAIILFIAIQRIVMNFIWKMTVLSVKKKEPCLDYDLIRSLLEKKFEIIDLVFNFDSDVIKNDIRITALIIYVLKEAVSRKSQKFGSINVSIDAYYKHVIIMNLEYAKVTMDSISGFVNKLIIRSGVRALKGDYTDMQKNLMHHITLTIPYN